METSQLANLGDLAALLQLPAQGAVQGLPSAQAPGLQATAGAPFSQILQQFNLPAGSAVELPQVAHVGQAVATGAVTGIKPIESESGLPLLASGKPLPLLRQALATQTDDAAALTTAEADTPDLPDTAIPALAGSVADSPAVARTVNESALQQRPDWALAQGFSGTRGVEQAADVDGAVPATPAQVTRDAVVHNGQATQQPLAAAPEKPVDVPSEEGEVPSPLTPSGRSASDTDAKTALPFEIPGKNRRVDDTPSAPPRSVDSIANLSFSRTAATPVVADSQPVTGFSEKALADAFTEKVVWMTGQGAQRANLQLHPAELGALQIRVTMIDNSAQVEIHAQNADTGDMLETLLPRLQSALEQQGVKVDELKLNANALFAENGEERPEHSARSDSTAQRGDAETDADGSDGTETTVSIIDSQDRRVDYYA